MASSRDERNQYNRYTPFDEIVTTSETTTFALSSQWDDVEYRNIITTSGSGDVSNTNGAFRLSTCQTSGSVARIESKQAGIYKPGSQAVAGLGIRVVQSGSANFDARFGFFDEDNGFGWGYDEIDSYVFYRRFGNQTKVYRDNWNGDQFGPDSEFELDEGELNIKLIEYIYYGSGRIAWILANASGTDYRLNSSPSRQVAHVYDPYTDDSYQGPSIPQPDQPFTVEVDNNASTDDVIVDLTGRSYRRLDQGFSEQRRIVSQELNNYQLTAAEGTWEPIYAFRKTDQHNGFINHVNVRLEDVNVFSNENATFKVTQNNTVNEGNSTFGPPDGWTATGQSAVEVTRAANLDVADDGRPIAHNFVRGASGGGQVGKAEGGTNIQVNPPIGRNEVIVVWARPDTANATTVDTSVRHSESY